MGGQRFHFRFSRYVTRLSRMTLIALVPALFALVGLLVYLLASNAKVQEIGRIAMFCGLLALMFALSASSVQIGHTYR